jgi:hypothetical protein
LPLEKKLSSVMAEIAPTLKGFKRMPSPNTIKYIFVFKEGINHATEDGRDGPIAEHAPLMKKCFQD